MQNFIIAKLNLATLRAILFLHWETVRTPMEINEFMKGEPSAENSMRTTERAIREVRILRIREQYLLQGD